MNAAGAVHINGNVKNVFDEARNFKHFIYIYLYLRYRDNVYRYVLIEKHDVIYIRLRYTC